MGKLIMVLNDGTTWTDLEHCFIAEVPDDFDEDILPGEALGAIAGFTEDHIILKAPLTARGVARFPLTPVDRNINGDPFIQGREI